MNKNISNIVDNVVWNRVRGRVDNKVRNGILNQVWVKTRRIATWKKVGLQIQDVTRHRDSKYRVE